MSKMVVYMGEEIAYFEAPNSDILFIAESQSNDVKHFDNLFTDI